MRVLMLLSLMLIVSAARSEEKASAEVVKQEKGNPERWKDGTPVYGANDKPEPFTPYYKREDIEALKKSNPRCFDGKCEVEVKDAKAQKAIVVKDGKNREIWVETGLPIYDEGESPPAGQSFHRRSEIESVIKHNSNTACFGSAGESVKQVNFKQKSR